MILDGSGRRLLPFSITTEAASASPATARRHTMFVLPGAARVITCCDLGVALSTRMPGTPRVVADTAMLRRARRNHGKQEYCCIADRGRWRVHRSIDAADHGFQPAGRVGEPSASSGELPAG